MYYVYIIRSIKNGRYYTGTTSNLSKRLLAHNEGKNISTRPGKPWQLIYKECYSTKKEAWLRERQIKKYKHGEAFKKILTCWGVAPHHASRMRGKFRSNIKIYIPGSSNGPPFGRDLARL